MVKKISIITPSYNQGKYIEDAILSVINQKYSNFEHIIVDGKSSDETLDILKKYEHLTWISEKDSGQTEALEKAMKLSSGEIIGWLNADDYYAENVFNFVNKQFSENNQDALYGNLNYVNKEKKIISQRVSKSNYIISNKFVSKFICFIPSTTFFFKKEIFNNNVGFDRDINYGMDKDLFANIYSKNFLIKKFEFNFAYFRLHEDNKFEHKKSFKNFIIDCNEGIKIFNKYSNVKFPNNKFGIIIYFSIRFFLKVIGFCLFNFSLFKNKTS